MLGLCKLIKLTVEPDEAFESARTLRDKRALSSWGSQAVLAKELLEAGSWMWVEHWRGRPEGVALLTSKARGDEEGRFWAQNLTSSLPDWLCSRELSTSEVSEHFMGLTSQAQHPGLCETGICLNLLVNGCPAQHRAVKYPTQLFILA